MPTSSLYRLLCSKGKGGVFTKQPLTIYLLCYLCLVKAGRGYNEFVMNLISLTKLILYMATRGQVQISTQPLPNISVKTRENVERLRDLVI